MPKESSVNELTHFFTGYACARAARSRGDGFEAFYAGVAALAPDFDAVCGLLTDDPTFQHAVFSHTILGGLAFSAALFSVTLLVLGRAAGRVTTPPRLLALTLAGLASHLALDVFTYSGECATDSAHLYLWPASTASFHSDCLFGFTRTTRVLVEVAYSGALAVWLVRDWRVNGWGPLATFDPRRWWRVASGSEASGSVASGEGVSSEGGADYGEPVPPALKAYLALVLVLFVFMAAGYA
ncbi:MAG: hypothetical protein Kow0069_09750 [Promethearchaeota archaeon]